MLFSELRFVAFFAVVFAVHWGLRRHSLRKLWLLGASYAFYAGWDWRFLGLIVFSTLVDFVAGKRIEAGGSPRVRRSWLIASLTANLGVLGLFKYWDFFVESGAVFLESLGLQVSVPTLSLILPVGISFYTFQTLSYTIDVYRGRLEATHNPADFALFVAFFPQLVAGPIVRATEFLPQLAARTEFARVPVRACATLFLIGFVKKACVADNIAALVDPVFASPEAAATATLWLAMCLYGVQIYCDFSGYSDMAIAIAGLLGYRLPLNFDSPYTAASVTDFWRRWHISLSTWFRDYLYVPLGGNRGSAARTWLNLGLVFLLCGLWHGASWNFIVWGLVHGVLLAVERIVPVARRPVLSLARWGLTVLLVMLAWVPFRSGTLGDAWTFLCGLWSSPGTGLPALAPGWWVLVLGVGLMHFVMARRDVLTGAERVPAAVFAPAYGAAVALTLPWAAVDYQPFIYFQF